MADLSDVDAVAESLTWLRAHPRISTEFGGPDHVSGIPEAPWPHLVVGPSADGSLGELRWLITDSVLLEVYGDPRGTTGNAECKRLALVAALALKDIVDRPGAPGLTVVSYAVPSGVSIKAPLQTGQHRWQLGMRLTVHPAAA